MNIEELLATSDELARQSFELGLDSIGQLLQSHDHYHDVFKQSLNVVREQCREMRETTRENRGILVALLRCYRKTVEAAIFRVPIAQLIELQLDLRKTVYRSHTIPSCHRTTGIPACLDICEKALRLSSWASVLSKLQDTKDASLMDLVESVRSTQDSLHVSLTRDAFQGLRQELENHHQAIKSIKLDGVSQMFIKPLRIYLASCRALGEEQHQYMKGQTSCLYPYWIRLVWKAMLMLANIGTEDEWDDVIQVYQQFIVEYQQVVQGKEMKLQSGVDVWPRGEN